MFNKEKKEISPDAIGILNAYKWPDNIRELKNVVERPIILSGKNNMIERKHFPSTETN